MGVMLGTAAVINMTVENTSTHDDTVDHEHINPQVATLATTTKIHATAKHSDDDQKNSEESSDDDDHRPKVEETDYQE